MSVYGDIISAMKDVLDAAPYSGSPRPTVRVRKSPQIEDSDTSFPLVILVADPDSGDSEQEVTFTRDILYRYPFLVAIATKGNRTNEFSGTNLHEVREWARSTLNKVALTGASSVIDTTVKMLPSFSPDTGRPGTNFDVSGLLVEYLSQEVRTA